MRKDIEAGRTTQRAMAQKYGVSRRVAQRWATAPFEELSEDHLKEDQERSRAYSKFMSNFKSRKGQPSVKVGQFSYGGPQKLPIQEDLVRMIQEVDVPKDRAGFEELAKEFSIEALAHIVAVMRSDLVAPKVRLDAAVYLLDQVWGRPTQPVQHDGGVSTHEYSETVVRLINDDESRDLLRQLFRRGSSEGLGI